MANEEEKLLEEQLELQLGEQKDSLYGINDALTSDPHNAELLSVQEELVSVIKDAEEGLLQLKRARLLHEADSALHGSLWSPKDAEAEPIDPTKLHGSKLPIEDVEPEPLYPTDVELETLEEPSYSVGSKCRFRHTDGRWYNGQIVQLVGSCSAIVSYLTPTSEKMMICKFFLQQRCRFGANCRLSHGAHVPLSSLKKYVPPCWGQSYAGSNILAVSQSRPGIWREAELESWDDNLNQGLVVFRDNGSYEKLGVEAITSSLYAQISDEEEEESGYSSSDQSGSSDYEEDGLPPQGLGFVESTALQRGVQTDTIIFAKWENHTRGIASKMMANMGYREGMGLGLSGQGMVDPIPVKVLPPKQSLDHALRSSKTEDNEGSQERKKKRSRGGKKKRDRKHAEAARAARRVEEERPDVFSLINSHLATHGEMISEHSTSTTKKQKSKEGKEDRRSLIAYEDEVKELRIRVDKLEEMVNRNRKEKTVYEAAMRKLLETRKALAEAEAKHASASHAVVSKEKEKRWLRF